jgi:putative addiction module component (TIGR02574 family)
MSTKDVFAAAMKLPPPERARLASYLLHSLDDAERADEATVAWTAELDRRLDDVRTGRVELVDLDEVKRRMSERRARRAATR